MSEEQSQQTQQTTTYSSPEEKNPPSSKTQTANNAGRWVLAIVWLVISLFFGIGFILWGVEFSASSFIIFLLKLLSISLTISLLSFAPIFFLLKKWFLKGLVVIASVASAIYMFNSTGVSYFIPPIPIYTGGYDVEYKYQNSGMGEMDTNELSLKFKITSTSNITSERKQVASFYEKELLKRGWAFSAAPMSCEDKIKNRQDPLCHINTGGGRFDLIFGGQYVTFYLFSK